MMNVVGFDWKSYIKSLIYKLLGCYLLFGQLGWLPRLVLVHRYWIGGMTTVAVMRFRGQQFGSPLVHAVHSLILRKVGTDSCFPHYVVVEKYMLRMKCFAVAPIASSEDY